MSKNEKREGLNEFRKRIGSFQARGFPPGEPLMTNNNLTAKVDEEGRLLPYIGSTVLYMLPEWAKEKVRLIQEELYGSYGSFFADRLNSEMFHLTIHDLISGPPSYQTAEAAIKNFPEVEQCVERIKAKGENIILRSTYVFNMTGTSLVWGFEPADEENYRRLMDAYEPLENIVRLDYPFTPHVTIAYFKPGTYENISVIQPFIQKVNAQEKTEVILTPELLGQYFFSDMDHYWKAEQGGYLWRSGSL